MPLTVESDIARFAGPAAASSVLSRHPEDILGLLSERPDHVLGRFHFLVRHGPPEVGRVLHLHDIVGDGGATVAARRLPFDRARAAGDFDDFRFRWNAGLVWKKMRRN